MARQPETIAGVDDVDLSGRTVFVTGATSGIGREMALALGRLGARVFVHGRDADRGRAVVDDISGTAADGKRLFTADLASQATVRDLAADVADAGDVDVLCNNAGAYVREGRLTEDGIEYTLAVNHLAPFLLTRELLPTLRESDLGRVVTTASGAHHQGEIDEGSFQSVDDFGGWRAYSQSKLANVLFTAELDRRVDGVTATCFHPGFVPGSGFLRNLPGPLYWVGKRVAALPFVGTSQAEGASTGVLLAADPPPGAGGSYFADREPATPSKPARDPDLAARLWDVSEELTAPARGDRPVTAE